MKIISIPESNYHPGREGYVPQAIVLHTTGGNMEMVNSKFTSPGAKVSAHYVISKLGQVHQYVPEKYTAFHTGLVNHPKWWLIKQKPNGEYVDPDFYTIGIEHEGLLNDDWTDEQYNASGKLIKEISSRWNIPIDLKHVIGHNQINSLKACPGEKIDIDRLLGIALHL